VRIVTLARKPLSEGTVASNVLVYGTGALNIDASRISSPGETIENHSRSSDSAVSKGIYGDSSGQETHQTSGQKLGRWPGNLILGHKPGCQRVGTREVKSDGHHPKNRGSGSQVSGPTGHAGQEGLAERYAKDETIANWECELGCPVAELDGQVPNAGAAAPVKGSESSAAVTAEGVYGNRARVKGVFHGDKGGASRFFKQIHGE